jgi:arylsulfatase A-like enzyme
MTKRPNVLWLMSDQHNPNCTGYEGHPLVRTPNLDRIAEGGVNFTNGFANNPICAPSRFCFMTGQYMHTHRLFGNDMSEYPEANPNTLACLFRRYGYQTGLFGKSHMIRRWDEDGFERIRYTDLTDALHDDPLTCHYFKYLDDLGLADFYEEGNPRPGMEHTLDGSGPAQLPYEHSIEHYTGEETLSFLKERDESRPFFVQMSFQRPHAPIAPAAEHFGMYDPEEVVLPESACDFLENDLATKPEFLREYIGEYCEYPLADKDPARLKQCLASYYALITAIDMEIGRVLDLLKEAGELENTIIFYTADHGDFAGEHGFFHKNFGLYESIQRIPFLLSWPGGPKGARKEGLVESVDLYPTLCELCDVPMPEGRDGASVAPVALGESDGKEAVYCEWDWGVAGGKFSAIRTKEHRLVFYGRGNGGELYDRRTDPGEINNLWDDAGHVDIKVDLLDRLLSFTLDYQAESTPQDDRNSNYLHRFSPVMQLHKKQSGWSILKDAYDRKAEWPPKK